MSVEQDWESYLTTLQNWAEQTGGVHEVDLQLPHHPDTSLTQENASQAQRVLGVLEDAAERTRTAQQDIGQQLSALNRLPDLDPEHSRYLDTTG